MYAVPANEGTGVLNAALTNPGGGTDTYSGTQYQPRGGGGESHTQHQSQTGGEHFDALFRKNDRGTGL